MDKLFIKKADTYAVQRKNSKNIGNSYKFNLTNRLELRMIRIAVGTCREKKERWSHEFS